MVLYLAIVNIKLCLKFPNFSLDTAYKIYSYRKKSVNEDAEKLCPFEKYSLLYNYPNISVPTSSDEFCCAPSSEREFCLVVIVWLLLPIHNHNYNKLRGKITLKKAKALT